jgi:hypothetical protein
MLVHDVLVQIYLQILPKIEYDMGDLGGQNPRMLLLSSKSNQDLNNLRSKPGVSFSSAIYIGFQKNKD